MATCANQNLWNAARTVLREHYWFEFYSPFIKITNDLDIQLLEMEKGVRKS